MQTTLTAYGVNWTETMERFVNSEELYMECLEMLTKDESLSLLEARLSEGNLRGAFEAAHTLKGVAANMGLTPLTQAADALVAPLRTGTQKDYTPDLNRLKAEFSRIICLYETLTQPTQAGGAPCSILPRS